MTGVRLMIVVASGYNFVVLSLLSIHFTGTHSGCLWSRFHDENFVCL